MRKDIDRLKNPHKNEYKSRRSSNTAEQQGVNDLIFDETTLVDYQHYEQLHKLSDERNVSKRSFTSNFKKSLMFFNDEAMIELLQSKFAKQSEQIRNKEESLELAKYMVQNHGGCPLMGSMQKNKNIK